VAVLNIEMKALSKMGDLWPPQLPRRWQM